MHFELLKRIPVSGTFTERQYSSSAKSNLWVRFELDDGSEWVGIFGHSGLALYNAVVSFPDDASTILVVAGGQGYIIDVITGELIRKTPWDYSYSAIPVPGRDFVLLANNTQIWATYRDRDVGTVRNKHEWFDDVLTPPDVRVALDGIVFNAPGKEQISGYVWDSGAWFTFTLHYEGFFFERGELVARGEETIYGSVERGGFPPAPETITAARELAL